MARTLIPTMGPSQGFKKTNPILPTTSALCPQEGARSMPQLPATSGRGSTFPEAGESSGFNRAVQPGSWGPWVPSCFPSVPLPIPCGEEEATREDSKM